MNLNNLNQLGEEIKLNIKKYNFKESKLSPEFKAEFNKYISSNTNDKIEFGEYTSIVTTPKGLKIIFPNQWFFIALFFQTYLIELESYKEILNQLDLTDSEIKLARDNGIDNKLKEKIKKTLGNESNIDFFEKFITKYEWWFGSKTVDRSDYYVSAVLNLSNVVNVSHSYIAELAYYISKEQKLAELLKKDYNLISQGQIIKTNTLFEEKKLRLILFKAFKFILKEYGESKVLKGFKIKEVNIEDRKYNGITLPNYFGFEVLVGLFAEKQTSDNLKSSGTLRFIDEAITLNNNSNSYFTSQWNEVSDRGLSLVNFNNLLKDVSNDKLEIINKEGIFILIEKWINSSPLKKTEQIIFFGAPGTGKSYKIDLILKNIDSKFHERVTFHPEYDNASFIGSYKPKTEKQNGIDEIKYKFVPQAFTDIYVRAWSDLENQYYLAIEEINRGNCAEIFGDIFQLLDRNSSYTVSPSQELKEYIIEQLGSKHEGITNGLKLPPNLSILATMNTSDQSLFPMDSAFKRRWNWEYIPICYNERTEDDKENEAYRYLVHLDENTTFEWIKFIEAVNSNKIKTNKNLGMDKCIGNYFIKCNSNEITLNEFINKAIFYLWNDVFKDEEHSESIFDKGTSYEDFFPIKTNGKDQVIKILKLLNIELKVSQ
jgi:hypothetical protein